MRAWSLAKAPATLLEWMGFKVKILVSKKSWHFKTEPHFVAFFLLDLVPRDLSDEASMKSDSLLTSSGESKVLLPASRLTTGDFFAVLQINWTQYSSINRFYTTVTF